MTTALALGVRDATAADDAALVELASACTMEGDVALRVERAPSFLALNALEGDPWRVGVAEDAHGRVVGCVAAARRVVSVNGEPTVIGYVGDLKVHPSARGSGVADSLSCWVRDAAAELAGSDAPVVITVLAGNARMERRMHGPRGTPTFTRFATISALAIPLLWPRGERVGGLTVRNAERADVEPMVALWNAQARKRQLGEVLDAEGLAEWIARAPGLSVTDYLVAHDTHGRLRGFMGVWDQSPLKQLRVVSYSARLAVARRLVNLVAPLAGTPKLPAEGGEFPVLAAVHVCATEPIVLRALLLEAYRTRRGGRHALLTIGLDVRDPLVEATRGLFAQPTLVHAYAANARGADDARAFAALPLHHETALV